MTSAAIYARVSSARQKKDETIGSQTAALREHAAQARLDVPEEWVFEDEGHSGATLVRPALEALRDLAAQGLVDVVLCYSPDRLARKFAYQALLLEEFARAGVRVEFVKGPRGDTPEDQLLVQFQGIFAEYEKAQLAERYRRGKAHRARGGSVNVLGGAPYGYRYLRRTDHSGAVYEIAEHEATLVAEMFRRYADDGASIAELTRWLTDSGVPSSHRQDPLGSVGALGDAAQPRLRRARGLRQDDGRARIGGPEPGGPVAGPIRGQGDQDRGPAPRGVDRDPGPGDDRAGHLRPRAKAAGRQQEVLGSEYVPKAIAAARYFGLLGVWLRLLPHLHAHHEQEDLLLPMPGLGQLPLRRRQDLRQQAGPRGTTSTRSSGTTSPPCSPIPT